MARPGDDDLPAASVRERLARFLPGWAPVGSDADAPGDPDGGQALAGEPSWDDIPIVPAPLGRPRPPAGPLEDPGDSAAPQDASGEPTPLPEVPAGPPDELPLATTWAAAPTPSFAVPPTLSAGAPPASTASPSASAGPPPAVGSPPSPASRSAPAPAGNPAREPAGPRGRPPGGTAPEELLQVPPSVGLAADDFFDGLIRQAQDDR
jgi:hypothetical protein